MRDIPDSFGVSALKRHEVRLVWKEGCAGPVECRPAFHVYLCSFPFGFSPRTLLISTRRVNSMVRVALVPIPIPIHSLLYLPGDWVEMVQRTTSTCCGGWLTRLSSFRRHPTAPIHVSWRIRL